MLDERTATIDAFAKAGADLISIHIEPSYDHAATLARIRALGANAASFLNPGTLAAAIRHLLGAVDHGS